MRALLLFLAIFVVFSISIKAQAPQFAVVRPNGTTYICPTFDSAYVLAQDGDYVYLPGTVIAGNKTIEKSLSIIGAGHYPDSTIYTGKTVFTGQFYISKKCTLEGFEVMNQIELAMTASNSSFIRMRMNPGLYLSGADNIYINGSILNFISGGNASSCISDISTNLYCTNSILTNAYKLQFSSFKNCILLGYTTGTNYINLANSIFSNCIFSGRYYNDWGFAPNCFSLVGLTTNNCLWQGTIDLPGTNNYVTTNMQLEFVNIGVNVLFDYNFDYHLVPNSSYLTAGDDGTQIGIYGGSTPYKEGAVPSNPHIYFKQVAPQTNSNGFLEVHFKVRTDN